MRQVRETVDGLSAPRTCLLSKSREPASAMAVNESGSGSAADGKAEEGVDRSFERAGTLVYLGE